MRDYSKTPWTVSASGVNKTIIRAEHGGIVATLEAGYQAMRESDAAFIVRACNAHDELVAALEAVRDMFNNPDGDLASLDIAAIRAALAKAKGEA